MRTLPILRLALVTTGADLRAHIARSDHGGLGLSEDRAQGKQTYYGEETEKKKYHVTNRAGMAIYQYYLMTS